MLTNSLRRLIAVSFFLVCPAVAFAQSYACPSSSTGVPRLRAFAIELATDSGYQELRDSLPLANVDTAQIAVVTADSVCDGVTKGIAARGTGVATASFLVVRLGSFYVASVPDRTGSIYILDDHYVVKAVFVAT
jgi:hypothetical protein